MARYRAERHEIAARYAEFEVIGEPKIRDGALFHSTLQRNDKGGDGD